MKKLIFTMFFMGFITLVPSSLQHLITSSLSAQIPSDGLVAWYPFNGNANDESGNGNHGTVNGATLTADRLGSGNKAYHFDGNQQTIAVANSALLSTMSEMTFSCWVKPESWYTNPSYGTLYFPIVCKSNVSSSGGLFSFFLQPGGFYSYFDGYQAGFGTGDLLNTWVNLTVTVTSAKVMKCYMNGELINEYQASSVAFPHNNNLDMIIGGDFPGQAEYAIGTIDNLAFYNRILTPLEIQQLYQDQTGQLQQNTTCLPSYVPTDGLVGYWPFCGNANDESGNGNDGAVNGATLNTDRFGNQNGAYSFNGTGDYIFCGEHNQLSYSNANKISLSFWFNSSSTSSNNSDPFDLRSMNNNSIQVYLNGPNTNGIQLNNWNHLDWCGSSEQSTMDFTENQWQHLVEIVDFDNNTMTLYFNGQLTETIQIPGCAQLGRLTNPKLNIGSRFDMYGSRCCFFQGLMDDFGLWNRVLTPQEIQALYLSGQAPCTPVSNSISATIIQDQSYTLGTQTLTTAATYTEVFTSTTGCDSTVTLTLSVEPLLTCNITAPTTTLCEGESVTLSVNTTGGAGASSQLPANLQQGLVAYYPFNGNANDESGNGLNGEIYSAALTTDRSNAPNHSFMFDGVNSYIQVPHSDFLNFQNQNSFSLSYWINPFSLSNNQVSVVLSKQDGAGISQDGFNSNIEVEFQSSFRIMSGNSTSQYTLGTTPNSIESGNWYHVVQTYDGFKGSIYIDGNLITSTEGLAEIGDNLSSMLIGKPNWVASNVKNFHGKIDDITIHNRALSPSEIQQLYTAQSYAWSTNEITPTITVTSTANTTYSCTVTQGNQTCTASVDITVNPNVTNAISATIIEGETYTLGTQTLTTAGTYTEVFTSAAGCDSTVTLTLSVEPALTCEITTTTTTLCAGESVTLSVNTTGGAGASSQLPANLQQGLVAYYPFNGNANDESENGNDGVVNGATLTSDRNGNLNSAYNFNGQGQTIDFSSPFLGGGQVNQFTMRTVVRFNSIANSPNIWGKTFFWGEVNFLVESTGKVILRWANSITGNKYSTISSDVGIISPNVWYDIIAIFNNGGASIYVNGVLVTTFLNWTAQGGGFISSSTVESYCNFAQLPSSSKIGLRYTGGNPGNYIEGSVDEFSIWNRSIDQSEVQQLINSQSYAWSTNENTPTITVSPISNTTYSCTVTEGNSTCTASVDITVNPAITNVVSATIVQGQSYTLGTQTLTTAGTYTEVFTSSTGCDSTVNLTLAVDPLLTCEITAPTTTLCEGESVTLSVNTTGGAGTSSQLPANLQQGLVAYYPFNGNANDESGNGGIGSLTAGNFLTNSNGLDYLYFDGLQTELTIPTSQEFNCLLGDFAIGFNIRNDLSIGHIGAHIVHFPDGFPTVSFGGDNIVNFGKQGFFSIISSSMVLANEWTNFVIQRQGNLFKIYINGTLSSQISNPVSFNFIPGVAMRIGYADQGGNNGRYRFKGGMDEFMIFNRALTPSEIQQLYTAQSYVWSNNANTPTITVSPTQTTTYSCTVTQGNQTCTASVDITVNPNVTNTISASIIEGETYALGSQTLNTGGTFTEVFTSAAGCDSTVTLTLSVEPLLTCSITNTSTVLCSGEQIDVSINSQITQSLSLLDSLTYAGEFAGHYYYFTQFTSNDLGQVGTQLTPLNLQDRLNVYGLNLVAIQNAEENNFVASLIPNGQFAIWIGLNDYVTNGVYMWSDGSLPSYFNWRSGEPNDNSGDEDYVIMYGPVSYPGAYSTWNDEPCGEGVGPCNPFLFLVESPNVISQNVSSYSWSNNATTPTITVSPTTNTTYSCTVTQGNQTCTASVDITVNPNITNDISATIIEGETYTLGAQTLTTTGTYTEVFNSLAGCDSTVTLTLTVEPLLTCDVSASINDLCLGESLELSVNASYTLIDSHGSAVTNQWNHTFNTVVNRQYKLVISGLYSVGTYCPQMVNDPAYQLPGFYGDINPVIRDIGGVQDGLYCTAFAPNNFVRPTPDVYNPNHIYEYYFTAVSESFNVGFNDCCWGDNCGSVNFELYEISSSMIISWFTNETTPTISVSPTQTTTYTATVTTANQTCTDSITITVNPLLTWYADADADGFGSPDDVVQDCNQPQGYTADNSDCNDEDAATYPGAAEICDNNRDENCDGVDSLCFVPVLGCTDINACNFNPEANTEDGSCVLPQPETCNGLDDNCNGQIDEGFSAAAINAVSAVTALYPVCSGNSIRSANLNNGANSAVIDGNGNDLWYNFTAQFNTFRAGLSAASGDNDVRLYTMTPGGCLELIETEHETTMGNQTLLSDQLTVGQTYYVAVHNISGAMNASAKICFNHLNASTCDHYYSNNTGIYNSVCNSFKAQYRANAVAYTFDVLSATQNNVNQNITPWSYTTTSTSTVVARLGTLLPANQGTSAIVYTLKVPVLYSLFDAAGNFENLFAQATSTCTVTLNAETTIALRSSDRCPTNKSLTSTIAPDRTVCGAMRYDWEFTQVLPIAGTAQVIQGGAYASVFFLSNVPGITAGKTYNVRVRPVHSSGITGNWGAVQCLRVGSAGMINHPGSADAEPPLLLLRTGGEMNSSFAIYPNPTATGSFVLEYSEQGTGDEETSDEEKRELVMMDITGKVVFKTNVVLNGNVAEIHFGDLESGLYLIDFGGERSRLQVAR